MRGEADAATPTLVRVHVQNPLADALHWRRADFGPAVGDVLAAIAARRPRRAGAAGRARRMPTRCWRASASAAEPSSRQAAQGACLAEWRRNGAGAQILADLGLGRLRVLGTPRKQVGLAGFGLEVVEYVELPQPTAAKLRVPP